MKMQKFVFIVKGYFKMNMLMIKNIVKLGTIFSIRVDIELLHLAYVIYSIVYLKKLL